MSDHQLSANIVNVVNAYGPSPAGPQSYNRLFLASAAGQVPTVVDAQVAWVLRRHEIDYHAPAMPRDEIVARTWVGVAEGLTFERHVEILRASDRKVLARSRTLWCPINVVTGRVTRVSPELRALFSVP